MKKKEIRQIFKDVYTFSKDVQSGGNAQVFFVKDRKSDQDMALKILDSNLDDFETKIKRFETETLKVLELQKDIKGIIPIYDYGLNDTHRNNLYWYTMPVAIPIKEHLAKITNENAYIEEVIRLVIDLADTLSILHSEDIVHRDIKPENIYFYNDQCCLSDFGLVDYPTNETLTKTGERIGANSTIAPEMKINAKTADGKKADIYSLGKTLWMLLTKNKYGFEGTYNIESDKINLEKLYPTTHWIELNDLLIQSTQYNPEDRLDIKKFKQKLLEYLNIYNNFEKQNLSQWKYVQNILFGKHIPNSCKWTNSSDIVDVLNILQRKTTFNHMFLPGLGGGQDFESAELCEEKGFICINIGYPILVNPKSLTVENIDKDYRWTYFRLELEEIDPIEKNIDSYNNCRDYLTEDTPGHYISWIFGNYGYYENDEPLPQEYRMVYRYFKGSFVIFSKSSIYNQKINTYDARHDKMSSLEFRRYIHYLKNLYNTLPEKSFISIANPDPFEKNKHEETKNITTNYNEFKNYIENNFQTWDFSALCSKEKNKHNSKLCYFIKFIFCKPNFKSLEEYYNRKNLYYYLSSNGKLEQNCDSKYILYDRNKAKDFIEKFKDKIIYYCTQNNIMVDDYYVNGLVSLEIYKIDKPVHLFTKDEIRDVMKVGNDSKNNTLVIDENGYPQLISSFEDKHLYPVSHETYCAYNNYVGKYSNLYTLEDDYISSLQGWLSYLKNGESVYIDYVDNNNNENNLIEEIKKFY